MKHRFLVSVGALAVVIALAWLAPVPVAGQAPTGAKARTNAAAGAWTPPRTPDGKVDLQGVWDYRSITPLERPNEAGAKEVYTDEEAAEFEQRAQRNQDRRDGAGTDADVSRAYNDFWWDFGRKITTKRTSMIVDPPDGRLPALTPEAQKRGVGAGRGGVGGGGFAAAGAGAAGAGAAAAGVAGRGAGGGGRGSDSWLDRSTWERCLTYGAVPRLSGAYNNNFQLFQSRDYVVIEYEMIHEARVIPMDGRPHGKIRQWLGDSRGHWEGDVLVVDTINFTDKLNFRGANTNLHLIERFSRPDADTLLYEFTVDDPTTWTKKWTAQVPMAKNPQGMYEYACHEGNYGMLGILSGGRAQDKAAEEAAKKGSK